LVGKSQGKKGLGEPYRKANGGKGMYQASFSLEVPEISEGTFIMVLQGKKLSTPPGRRVEREPLSKEGRFL